MAKKKRAYHHGDLRRELLDASVDLLVRRGVEDLSLREVARHAGVSSAAPYHHFANKSELLRAIALDGFARLGDAMGGAVERSEKAAPTERLRALGEAYVRFAIEHPAHFHVMFHPSLLFPQELGTDGPPARAFQMLVDVVAEVLTVLEGSTISKGMIDGRVSQGSLVVLAWSLVHGAATLVLDGPLANGLPNLGVAAEAIPSLVTQAFEALISRRLPDATPHRSRRPRTSSRAR